jgi:hypothetical protein
VRILVVDPTETMLLSLQSSVIHLSRYEEPAKLYDHRSYSAVSYTRGEPEFSGRIIIKNNGPDNDSYLPITDNVKSMLQHLRKPHNPIYLWVDAICLNQEDENEKAEQIPLMGKIYSQAHRVYIWLGSGNLDDAKILLAFRSSLYLQRR